MSFSPTPSHDNYERRIPSTSPDIEVDFGGEPIVLNPANTFIRRFADSGAYDYCVHLRFVQGSSGAPTTEQFQFQPEAELMDEMERLGFTTHNYDGLDIEGTHFLLTLREQAQLLAAERADAVPELSDASAQDIEDLLAMNPSPEDQQ